jgi:hypothetical protein
LRQAGLASKREKQGARGGRRGLIYNAFVIALARAVMALCTWLFFIGIAGSLLVIFISFFEDLNELVGKE